jgi:hypothetical protein
MGVVVVAVGNGRRESEEDIIPQSVGRPFCELVLSSFISKGASAIVHSASASIQQPVRWLSHIKVLSDMKRHKYTQMMGEILKRCHGLESILSRVG